jgi:hypothetical protein
MVRFYVGLYVCTVLDIPTCFERILVNLVPFQPISEIIIVGDVHGRILDLNAKAGKHTKTLHFQLGDLGAGFVNIDKLAPNIIWTRGNHDNPRVCQEHPLYAGDWGTLQGRDKTLYFIGGGYSIDQDMRVPGISWWEDEELSYGQLDHIIKDVIEKKPQVIVSHECPSSIIQFVGYSKHFNIPPSRTAMALDRIFEQYKPQMWVFGHHHCSWWDSVKGTQFRCLREFEAFKISL